MHLSVDAFEAITTYPLHLHIYAFQALSRKYFRIAHTKTASPASLTFMRSSVLVSFDYQGHNRVSWKFLDRLLPRDPLDSSVQSFSSVALPVRTVKKPKSRWIWIWMPPPQRPQRKRPPTGITPARRPRHSPLPSRSPTTIPSPPSLDCISFIHPRAGHCQAPRGARDQTSFFPCLRALSISSMRFLISSRLNPSSRARLYSSSTSSSLPWTFFFMTVPR